MNVCKIEGCADECVRHWLTRKYTHATCGKHRARVRGADGRRPDNDGRIFGPDPVTGKRVYLGMSVSSQPQDNPLDAFEIEHDAIVFATKVAEQAARQGRDGSIQSKFRKAVIARDGDRCIISTAPANRSHAAHIIPWDDAMGGNAVANGILLRADLHGALDDYEWTFLAGKVVVLTRDPCYQWMVGLPVPNNKFTREHYKRCIYKQMDAAA